MSNFLEYKKEVLSAVRQYVEAVNDGRNTDAALAKVVETTSQWPLTHLDSLERAIRWELYRINEPTGSSILKWFARTERPITWLDLITGNGYKREKALRSLSGGAPNRFFFALAVRRLNDWVPQVREAARERLLTIARDTDPDYVVDVLCAILPHWTSWGRMTDGDRDALVTLFSIDQVTLLLKSRIISATTGPMTTILAQVGRSPVLDVYLEEIAKNAIQPAVRAKAYRCLLEGKMVWFVGRKWRWTEKRWCKGRFEPVLGERPVDIATPFLETLKLVIMDRSPIVRRVVGEALIREMNTIGAESLELATVLASDPSPSVAERGRYVLKHFGDGDT